MPPLLPAARWALTPPFHPYRVLPKANPGHAAAVYFLWRYPSDLSARALPGTNALWSPDFPRGACAPRGHPALCAHRPYAAENLASSGGRGFGGLAPLGLRPIHPRVLTAKRKLQSSCDTGLELCKFATGQFFDYSKVFSFDLFDVSSLRPEPISKSLKRRRL